LSTKTIEHLLTAPNFATAASTHYKNLIQAVCARPKTTKKLHRNEYATELKFTSPKKAHFCSAQVSIVMELFTMFAETMIISGDNKNKIALGVPAVNRESQARKFFLEQAMPHLPIHDFPKSGWHNIVPSGYLICKSPRIEDSFDPNAPANYSTYTDRHDRLRVDWSRTGPLYIFNRALEFHSSNLDTHLNDIHCVLGKQETKPLSLLLCVDRGPDWKFKDLANILGYGLLWVKEDLDILCVSAYAEYCSSFNPIERKFSVY
jgi:hypothetical protein